MRLPGLTGISNFTELFILNFLLPCLARLPAGSHEKTKKQAREGEREGGRCGKDPRRHKSVTHTHSHTYARDYARDESVVGGIEERGKRNRPLSLHVPSRSLHISASEHKRDEAQTQGLSLSVDTHTTHTHTHTHTHCTHTHATYARRFSRAIYII